MSVEGLDRDLIGYLINNSDNYYSDEEQVAQFNIVPEDIEHIEFLDHNWRNHSTIQWTGGV